jgi:hypothetical protein
MRRVILTIAIVLCAASAFADNHRGYRGDADNGNHYGQYWKHDSHRKHECRNEREYRPTQVVYQPEYRIVQTPPPIYVSYPPQHRQTEPHVSVSVQLPGLILSFLTGR